MAPRNPRVKYPPAQERFVKRTRDAIDSNPAYFDTHDWRSIFPSGGTRSSLTKPVSTESFYVKPIAAWVPDKLFEHHVPCCPRCRSNRYVDVKGARWINTPKILFGVSTHKYLDTKLYPCRGCSKRFTGYNRESMAVDHDKYMGFFNFYLSSRFAADEELIAFVSNMYDKSTATIQRVLTAMTTEKYLSDHIYYLHACRANRIKKTATNVIDGGQSTLDPLLENLSEAPTAPPAERTLLRLKSDFKRTRLNLLLAESNARNPIHFGDLIKTKSGRNKLVTKGMLASVGKGKLQQLIDAGFETGKDLVAYNGIHHNWSHTARRRDAFRSTRKQVQDIFESRNGVVFALQQELNRLQEQIDKQQEEVDLQGIIVDDRGDNRQRAIINSLEERTQPFSKMTNSNGYNARIISSARIDNILQAHFLQRKPMAQSKITLFIFNDKN